MFGAGAATVLVAPSKVRTCYAAKLDFSCTNNIAEYEALLLGLRKLKAMRIRRAILKSDSQVIFDHVDKSSKARDLKLEKYLDTVRRLEASFEGFSVKNIPRGENEHAYLLAKSAAQGLPLPLEVFFETIRAPSVELMERNFPYVLGPCFVAEGPVGRNSFGKSCLYVMPKLPLMKLRCYSVSEDEGSNRLKDGITF
jgi:ribonuclease HI